MPRRILAFTILLATVPAGAADLQQIRSLNQNLREAVNHRTPAPADTLKRRAALLRMAIRENPGTAKSLLFQPEEIAALAQASPGAAADLETPASYTTDNATVVDSADWKSSWYFYRVSTPEGPLTAYQDSNDGVQPSCDTRMLIEGYRLGDTMLVTNSSVVVKADHPACSTLGDQHSAIILVSFPHAPISRMTIDQYKSVFFSDTAPSFNDFYREASYGKASVSGDVFGPFTLSRDYDSCVDSSAVEAEAVALADAAVDLTPYNRIFLITPPAATCTYGGFSNVGCVNYVLKKAGTLRLSRVYQFDASAAEILRVSPHELGHGLGLSHARTDALNNEPLGPDRTRMTYTEYGDSYSSMGGSGPRHFAAPHKALLQWLETDETATVSDDQRVDLLPMASPTHGLKGIRVERRIGSKQYVWIEYRRPTGYDSVLANLLSGGALIHFEDTTTGGYTELLNYGSSFNNAELRAGSTWRDPYSDLTIQVIEAAPDHLRVAVRHDPLCTSVTWPSSAAFAADAVSLMATFSSPTCDLTAIGNNFWLLPQPFTSSDGSVRFDVAANSDPIQRQGSLTVGRQTFFVRQAPLIHPLSVSYFGPAKATAMSTRYQIGVSLPNTTATTGSIDVLFSPTTSFQGECAFTYDFAARNARLLDNSGAAVGTPLATGSTQSLSNTVCGISSLTDTRTNAYFSNFFFTWLPRTTVSQNLNVYYRFRTSPDAAPGDWQQGGLVLSNPSACSIAADVPAIIAAAAAATYTVNISGTASCAWQAQSDAAWITPNTTSGSGAGRILIAVAANPGNTARTGTVNIGNIAIPVQQPATIGAAQPYVQFSQSELDVPRKASSASLQFSTSLHDGGISWIPSASWLRVTTYNTTVAGCPCVTVAWDSNLGDSPRQATLTPAQVDGTPVTGTVLHIVQDAGKLTPADYLLTTVVGADATFDGVPALSTILKQPQGVALAPDGSLLVAEFDGHRFRRIAPDGTASTFAGTGAPTTTPYTGSPLQIGTWQPESLTVDSDGNAYIVTNSQIRKITPDGTVSIVAGSGAQGFSGDNGPANRAAILFPMGAVVAPDKTVYFTDYGNQRVRKVSPNGIITTIAGTGTAGFSGDDGPATAARLASPWGIALGPDGSILVADRNNNRIRAITSDGKISTIAGTGSCGTAGNGGPAAKAQICSPTYLTVDGAGNIFIADTGNSRIRRISPDGTLATVAGTGSAATAKDAGPVATTPVGNSFGIAVSPSGDLYIPDSSSNRIRVVSNGAVSPFAGLGNFAEAGDGGAASESVFYRPNGLAFDAAGNLYISDNAANRVRRVSPDGIVAPFAGTGAASNSGDGNLATSAGVLQPNGIAAAPTGSVYIASNCTIRKVDSAGKISTYAGTGSCGFADNAAATKAQFSIIGGIALDAAGNLFVADPNNQRVRRVGTDGSVTTVAGNGKTGTPVDGAATDSFFNSPTDVAVDAAGNLYIADRSSYCIRKVTPDGQISTFAGIPRSSGYEGDTGPATRARFGSVQSVKVDDSGTVWVADTSYHVIRKISPDGIITTAAGTGSSGNARTDGPAWSLPLNTPSGLAIGPNGVYVSDSNNGRVRLLTRPQ